MNTVFVVVKHTNEKSVEVAAYSNLDKAHATKERLEKQNTQAHFNIITVPVKKESSRG
jgi:hypothetical protein